MTSLALNDLRRRKVIARNVNGRRKHVISLQGTFRSDLPEHNRKATVRGRRRIEASRTGLASAEQLALLGLEFVVGDDPFRFQIHQLFDFVGGGQPGCIPDVKASQCIVV